VLRGKHLLSVQLKIHVATYTRDALLECTWSDMLVNGFQLNRK